MTLDRNDYKTSLPQLEKRLAAVEAVGGKAITKIDLLSTLLDAEALERERLYQKNVTQMAQIITDVSADIENLQEQIDGNITTWFFDYVPTTSNYPASEWIQQGTEIVHLGDLFYNTATGYVYRWLSDGAEPPTYSWLRITDSDVTKALADAAAAQDTADHKRRVFVTTPVVPYDIGDLWCEGSTGDILTCTTPKTSAQSYAYSDWEKLNKYTDDTALTNWLTQTYTVDKTSLQNQIDGKAETWYQATDPSLEWTAAEKPYHEGDLWYRTTDNTTWYYTGSAWSQQEIPSSIFNTISGKANIFIGSTTPVDPKSGDLWLKSANDDILTYVAGSWVKYNKYTDDTVANQAVGAAQIAQTAAENAQTAAETAQSYAEAAQISAGEAAESATDAYNSASQALDQLGVVQDVIGVLDLISQHGEYQHTTDDEPLENKWYFLREGSGTTADPYTYVMPASVSFEYFLTSDVAIDANKTYYTRSGTGTEEDPYVFAVVETPDVSEIATYYENTRQNYYELVDVDQSIQNYISSHLALVGDSLYLQHGTTRIKLSTTDGVVLYNEAGDQVAQYGEDTIIGDITNFGIKIGKSPEWTQQNPVYELGFYQDGNRVAYINNNSLYITQTVVLKQMQMGDSNGTWAWCVHEVSGANNLYLKWLG